jgi:hypothetical protein
MKTLRIVFAAGHELKFSSDFADWHIDLERAIITVSEKLCPGSVRNYTISLHNALYAYEEKG